MSTPIESLVFVATTSLAELKAGVAALENADSRVIDARLRAVESVCTTLSSALDSLSKHMEALPPGDPNATQKAPVKPADDDGLLLMAAQKLGAILDAHSSFGGNEVFNEK